mmetsp:Transcript_6528/g.26883  ORF Transcript_6528/g.26883 Transcript_6528/m.26883 type:complete len:282 (+) Transcript_6528:774-1619(+)
MKYASCSAICTKPSGDTRHFFMKPLPYLENSRTVRSMSSASARASLSAPLIAALAESVRPQSRWDQRGLELSPRPQLSAQPAARAAASVLMPPFSRRSRKPAPKASGRSLPVLGSYGLTVFSFRIIATSITCAITGASAQECSALRPILPFWNTVMLKLLSNQQLLPSPMKRSRPRPVQSVFSNLASSPARRSTNAEPSTARRARRARPSLKWSARAWAHLVRFHAVRAATAPSSVVGGLRARLSSRMSSRDAQRETGSMMRPVLSQTSRVYQWPLESTAM